VAHQSYPNLEHLVMDGGSTDATPDILRRYPAVTWVSEPDNGQAEAINKGFRLAKGEIIGWLNADDAYQPGAIPAAAHYLHSHPEIDLVYGNFNFIDGGGQVIHRQVTPPFSLNKLLYAAIIPQTSMFFRRRVLNMVGGVNPQLHYVMDWEFTLRIARRCRVARVAETWGNFRIVEGTKSVREPENFWPEVVSVLAGVEADSEPSFQRQVAPAQLMAQLLAGLEYARVNKLTQSQQQFERFFANNPPLHPAVLASLLYKTAPRPWHSGFRRHRQAAQALDNISLGLQKTAAGRRVGACLQLYRAMKRLRQGRRPDLWPPLTPRDLLDWRVVRMAVGALLRPL
jgi:hypothetical protein